MILSRLFYAASCLLAFSSASITDCSNGASIFKVTDLVLTPDPPVKGKDLFMTVKFDNPGEELSKGTVTTSVSLNFIPFTPTTKPLCDSTQCPIVSGPNDRSTSSIWPDTVSGAISSKIVWNTIDGFQLLCIQIQAKISTEKVKNLRSSDDYNQTHADLIAELLDLNDPVPYNEFSNALSPYHGADMCYPWEASKELVVWKNFTNALLRSIASNTSEPRSN
jgi:hypothetical protein